MSPSSLLAKKQLIWTPKLINICEDDTRKLFVSLCFVPKKKMPRPFFIFQVCFSFLDCPFCYLPQVNNKAAKGLRIICTERWKQTCCFTCHLPLATQRNATPTSWVQLSRVESELSPVEFSYKIYLFRRNDLLPKGRPKKKAKTKPRDPWQAGYEVQGIVSSFGNEVTFQSVKILIALPFSNWKAHLTLSRYLFSLFSTFLFDLFLLIFNCYLQRVWRPCR